MSTKEHLKHAPLKDQDSNYNLDWPKEELEQAIEEGLKGGARKIGREEMKKMVAAAHAEKRKDA